MRNKILYTLLTFAAFAVPIGFITKLVESAQKYLSLNQLNNSELDYQIYHNIGDMAYVKYFLVVCLAFALAAIWKPKQNINE